MNTPEEKARLKAQKQADFLANQAKYASNQIVVGQAYVKRLRNTTRYTVASINEEENRVVLHTGNKCMIKTMHWCKKQLVKAKD